MNGEGLRNVLIQDISCSLPTPIKINLIGSMARLSRLFTKKKNAKNDNGPLVACCLTKGDEKYILTNILC